METLKSGWGRSRLRRYRMGVGLVIVFLIALASAGTFWSGFPVTKAQAPQGNDASYDIEVQKGVTMLRRHLWEDALKAFKRANEMRNKQSSECFYGMAQAYQGLRAYKNVLESCDRVIELSANDPRTQAQAYNLKGIALQTQAENKDQKKLQDAEAAFRQGLALGTGLPILQYNLGFTLLQQGHDPEGIAELRKFVELEKEGPKAEQALKMIENPRRAREAYAPDFSVTTSEGEYISLDDLRGKVVLLDFWGTWCPPCVSSVPELRDLRKRYAKESSFVMIGISSDGVEEKWRDFIVKNQMVWPQFLDRERKVQGAFEVTRFPTYIVIDHEGIMRYNAAGSGPERMNSLDDAIRKQLKILAKTQPAE